MLEQTHVSENEREELLREKRKTSASRRAQEDIMRRRLSRFLSLSLFSVKEQESGRHLLQDFEVEPFYQPSLEREEKDKCRKKKERRDSKPER